MFFPFETLLLAKVHFRKYINLVAGNNYVTFSRKKHAYFMAAAGKDLFTSNVERVKIKSEKVSIQFISCPIGNHVRDKP